MPVKGVGMMIDRQPCLLCWYLSVMALLCFKVALAAPVDQEWVLPDSGKTMIGQVFPAGRQQLVMMIPSRQGFEKGYEQLAEQLAEQGVTVWQPDWFGSYDQLPSESALNAVPEEDMANLLRLAAQRYAHVYILAVGRGAPIALAGWRAWQKMEPNATARAGLLLLSPNLIGKTPDPGQAAEYLSVTEVMDAPMWIFQPSLSPYYAGLATLARRLEAAGSSVWLEPLLGMRDRFFYRADANAAEQAYAKVFVPHLLLAMKQLAMNRTPRQWRALPTHGVSQKQAANTGKLLPMPAHEASELVLSDLSGQQQNLRRLHGQVVLVNFWASWCPPCVHEMPSMQRLLDANAQHGLALVAVNLGESPDTIRDFVQTYQLRFPVWLDETQSSAQRWKVFAYPTSYLIDRKGRVRYAIAGGADWMSPELRAAVESLLQEKD